MVDSQGKLSGSLQCIVVTPETTALDTQADFVALPLFDGEAGVAPGRAPLIGRLGYGELRVRTGGSTMRLYVDGGFVQVADNVVSVLTNRAVAAEKLDTAAATAQLEAAISRSSSGHEELAIRERQISQARGQLRVASRAQGGSRSHGL
jgi:F-type H+-transporting ATPase subunit epsilon